MSSVQNLPNMSVSAIKVSEKTSPTWRLVLRTELADLWIGGKVFSLLLIYSLLLGVMVYLYAFNTELRLIPPREATYEMLRNAMAVAIFVCLIVATDTISGERDRATLESLLLAPVKRREILIGKFLSALSFWPAALLFAIPYLYVLAQGDTVLVPSLFWGAVTGTILILGYTGLGMLVSFWSHSNRVSYFLALGIYAALLIPAQMWGNSGGAAGQFLQWMNPMSAVNHFLSRHLVSYRGFAELWTWLISSTVLAVVSMGVLLFVSPKLQLEPSVGSRLWRKLSRAIGLTLIAGLILVSLFSVSPVFARQSEQGISISIDTAVEHVKTGDTVRFATVVTNNRAEASPSLIVAMNLINLDERGSVVDPEDWSPRRTQYVQSLAPGQSAEHEWIIKTILEGNYMVYMVVLPEPQGVETTSQPIASQGIHLMVAPFTRLNPGGVLPFAFGGPLLVLVVMYFVYRWRRQQIDLGGSQKLIHLFLI